MTANLRPYAIAASVLQSTQTWKAAQMLCVLSSSRTPSGVDLRIVYAIIFPVGPGTAPSLPFPETPTRRT